MFRRIDERISVSGQLMPEDVAAAAAEGVTMIVNNRPDGEQPDQPSGSEIEAAARAAGIGYRHIPVRGGFSPDQVQSMAEAIEATEGQVLAFCAAGTRSAWLWALASAQAGEDPDLIVAKAAGAGYDLSALRPYLVS